MGEAARLDKWLWAARIYKTRSLAVDACKNGRVTKDGLRMKPSRQVRAGDVICVRKPPVTYSFRVKRAVECRVGAKLVPEVLENVTTADQYELLEMSRISGFVGRAKGLGRPTKRDRRKMDEFTAPVYIDKSITANNDDDMDDDFDFDIEDLIRR